MELNEVERRASSLNFGLPCVLCSLFGKFLSFICELGYLTLKRDLYSLIPEASHHPALVFLYNYFKNVSMHNHGLFKNKARTSNCPKANYSFMYDLLSSTDWTEVFLHFFTKSSTYVFL